MAQAAMRRQELVGLDLQQEYTRHFEQGSPAIFPDRAVFSVLVCELPLLSIQLMVVLLPENKTRPGWQRGAR